MGVYVFMCMFKFAFYYFILFGTRCDLGDSLRQGFMEELTGFMCNFVLIDMM